MKGYANSQLLVTPKELSSLLANRAAKQPLILDLRPPESYTDGHIPGAAFLSLDEDLSDLSIPPEVGGRHPLPSAERFAAAAGRAGIGPETLVVPVDYATYCAAEVARGAALFVVDHRDQFLANRDAGQFDGYPDPAAMFGEALADGRPRPAGRVVATHLGTGLADVVFGSAILEAAAERGLGTILTR